MSSPTPRCLHDNDYRLIGQANYREWAERFRSKCKASGFWEVFTREEVHSNLGPSTRKKENRRAASVSKAPVLNNLRDQLLWEKRFKTHYALFLLHHPVDTPIGHRIQKFRKPSEAWSYPKRKYQTPEPNRLELAQKKMEELDPKEYASLDDFLAQFTRIRRKILKAGGQFIESQSKLKIISGLQPEYVARLNREITYADIGRMTLAEFTDLLLTYAKEEL